MPRARLRREPSVYVQGNFCGSANAADVGERHVQRCANRKETSTSWLSGGTTVRRFVSGISDTQGNAYELAVGPTIIPGVASQSIYYSKNIVSAPAGSNTVTVTFAGAANFVDMRILEYEGADWNNPIDVTAAASGNSALSSSGSRNNNKRI